MIGRRALFGTGLCALGGVAGPIAADADAGAAMAGVPAGGVLLFEVFRKGTRIGTHRMTFSRNGDALTIAAAVRFDVGIGPLTLFRYRYAADERWDGGTFTGLDTTTDDDGTHRTVAARRVGDGIEVRASGQPDVVMQADAKPLTHWNRATLGGPLFNPETGRTMQVAATDVAGRQVALASGGAVQASGVRLSGGVQLTDWYDARGVWSALQAVVKKDGSTLDYRLSG